MSNNSATGGYLVPSQSEVPPAGLTLTQFIQTMIVGISGFTDATLVRPKWQIEPPKQPDIITDWIAFGISVDKADTYAAIILKDDGTTALNRQEMLAVQMSFYGPNALDNYSLFRDGLQLSQNNESLLLANMSYQDITEAVRGPDLVNERWLERYETTLTLVRQMVRIYPILSFTSAQGTVHTVLGNEDNNLDWMAEPPEDP